MWCIRPTRQREKWGSQMKKNKNSNGYGVGYKIGQVIGSLLKPFKRITCDHFDIRLPERATILSNGHLATIEVMQCVKCERTKKTVVPKGRL